MAADTFASDSDSGTRSPGSTHAPLNFGRITIVGGGCYGGYYVRQLGRAHTAKKITWRELIVVDRDPACGVSLLASDARPPALRLVTSPWADFFADYLESAALNEEQHATDAIVPSPLMPHLFGDWIVARARNHFSGRDVSVTPLARVPEARWQRGGDDGTHYVSFADWMCPINCIEPAVCPHTRSARDWSMPVSISRFGEAERSAGRDSGGAYVFRCIHRTFGVGMIDVSEILAADRAIAAAGAQGGTETLIGTASHCHGAIRRLVIGAPGTEGFPQ